MKKMTKKQYETYIQSFENYSRNLPEIEYLELMDEFQIDEIEVMDEMDLSTTDYLELRGAL